MKLLTSLRSLAVTLFYRSQVESEMDEELRAHIQNRADDLERSGLPRAEAERRARIEFGGYQRFKEECREAVGAQFFEGVLRDIRFGLRALRKSPGFTAVAVFTLALGIGANTAIFSLIDSVMLRQLPVQNPQELVLLKRVIPERAGVASPTFTNPLWEQIRDHQDVFTSAFAWSSEQFNLAQGGLVHNINGLFASGSYFGALGVRPAAGRLFTQAEDQRGCPALAVLSYGFWQRHFGAAQNAIGSTLSLNNHPFHVIGVSAPGFYGMEMGSKFDAAIPICASAQFAGEMSRLDHRSWWWLSIAGRVKPGISRKQLQARLAVLAPQVFAAALPQDWDANGQRNFLGWGLLNVPANAGTSDDMRREFGQPLAILMTVVGLVLLIACANLASLMFARATSRHREIAVRKALGASRRRLIRQLLTESLLLSFAGTVLGLLFARWGAALLVRYISTAQNQVFLALSFDGRVLGFAAAIAALTGVLFGILPALRSTSVSLLAAMKSGQVEETERRARVRPAKWIVASQVGLSLVLVVVAGLFLRSLVKLAALDIGFDRSNVLIVSTNLKEASIQPDQQLATYDEIEDRLRSLSGVISVAYSVRTPVSNWEWNEIVQVDSLNSPKGEDALVYFNFISPGYFHTLRTALLAGRDFGKDDRKNSPQIAIVNETFAHKFLPNQNPVGKLLRIPDSKGKPGRPIQIVGLVKDAKYETLREDTYSQAFFPASQLPESDDAENFEIRTAQRPSSLAAAAQNQIAQVNKSISLDFHSLAEQVDDSIVQDRVLASLSGFFGALALLIAMIGLYGTLSYLVAQRQAEFGIRVALGAPRSSIFSLMMREVAAILLVGSAAGICISLLVTRLIPKLLFGLSGHDPVTLAGAIAVLTVVALMAGYLPARRAMGVDPMAALRYE